MQSNTVVLQGSSYPICLVAGKGQTPSGYAPAVANTAQSAKQQIAEIGGALTGDAAKRLDVINLLNSAGVNCPRSASARETASVLTQALIAGAVTCFHQKAKSAIQVSDNTNSGSAGKKSNKKSSSTASGKSASQAPAKNTGGASNNTASEEPITNQECRSDPVSMLSGEEILPLIDFTLAGSRQLIWRRLYRSSHADVCTTMGNGWRHDFMASLTEHYLPPPKVGPKQKGTYWLEYQDEHGAKHKFEKVKPGQSSYQLSSNLALHYQTNGKQVLVTPDDQHLTFKPGESAWLLEKIINEKGQSIAFYYDAKERLHRIEVNKVRGCIISYNAQGLLSKIAAYYTDKNNKQQLLSPLLASYEYDENKNLVQSTNQQNETERYAYNAANLLTKRTRASGFSHHFEWDSYSPSAKCIKQWGDNNTYTYQFEYNSEAGETICIDSRGHKEHFVHNAQGKLVKHTDPNGNVWQYTYNAQGQKLSEIKPDSSITRYTYTPFGQLETITQPDGNQTHFAYNQLGQRVLTTLPDGQTITRKYSVAGLLQSETFGDGRTTLYSYDKLGQLTQHINKNGQITKFIWNEQGELLAKHHNDELIRYSYDSLGRVNATLNNAGLLTQYKYNEHGQLTQTIAFDEKEPENKQHQYFSYDEAGRLVSSQNSKGDTTEQHFEGLSQPHCVIQPDGSALHLTYDKERNLTAIERSDGHVYRISYDANENPTQITGFDGTLQQYKYDACNRLASVTQSNKRHVKIERDSLGRVTAQHASLASDSHIVNNANYYSYTKQGKIARAHNAQSTLKQTFDKGGRLLCAEQVNNQQQAHTLKYSYDEYGRRQTLTLPDSTTLKYSYNQFGQLSGINLLQTNSKEAELAKALVTLSYDSQGNIKTQHFGNSITLTQQFDVFNRLTQQQLIHPAQALFDTCTYNYDSVNQLIARKNEGVSSQNINFEYNSLGQLIQQTLASSRADTTTHYQWDSFGNPQSQTVQSNTSDADLRDIGEQGIEPDTASNEHTASSSIDLTRATHSEYNELVPNSSESSSKNSINADSVVNNEGTNNTTINSATDADRLTHFGDSDFYYDEFGNQIRETGKGIKTRREYNAFNQLSCFNNNGTLTQYDYDSLGRRIAKHTEHGKIDFIWDNDQLIGECQHGEYTWYINLPNQFHPVALIKKGELYYYHLDQLNTPRFVTNNKARVVWENKADVYGYEEPEVSTKNSFTQPIRFQGQYLDEESGLHYNRYRYYSPKQQRFINQDPIGLVGGINHYQYAPNPVNWVDPFGLTCKDGQKKNVFAGHGSIDVTKPATVPMGTSLTVYSWDGATITDDLGSKIEDGTVSSGVFKKVYTEGDVIPGYMLHPNCGSLNISSNSIQVTESKHISELLAENMGEYHWAACTYIDGHENSNIIHDEEGIFKEESGQYSQLKDGKWQSLEDEGGNDNTRNPNRLSDNLRNAVPASLPKAKKKRKKSLRLKYLGRTPGKKSRTGKEVINRMKAQGKIRSSFKGTEFQASNGKWYPLSEADMAHEPMDAVKYWNTTGRKHGPKSKQVRKWMLDSNNYTLDHYSSNRSAGAKLKERYKPPLG
ncbi:MULTISPECIES: RHS repeat-associated core domain-containing protein [unclassified Pseudoalteromonas]|uniref:RHS repeat-associated core domain-containing protein n=1 Tax=unclassified Pseudoalteromonas TaxID=194690 RepID=UPI0015FFA232|nr:MULTISPECIES: RHS repeat-associated core domain-containing protein [unclassified Pseudoalteromonas]MBB1349447.1 sugar-binding protein [Pseudoalteromonas sp. SG45-3]MBB1356871.1 sugar-binding protein [Pseudoalteromonas sp. SG45-6]